MPPPEISPLGRIGAARTPFAHVETTTAAREPKAVLRWDLPKSVITLNRGVSAIHLHLKNPGYQAWADEPEPEYEDED